MLLNLGLVTNIRPCHFKGARQSKAVVILNISLYILPIFFQSHLQELPVTIRQLCICKYNSLLNSPLTNVNTININAKCPRYHCYTERVVVP